MAAKRIFIAAITLAVACFIAVQVSAIVNGELDPTTGCVGAVLSNNQLCSGTLIDESWVLTAASCAADAIQFRTGPDFVDPSGIYNVADIIIHPHYNTVTGEFNFALLQISPPAFDRTPCPPASLPDDVEEGDYVRNVGYGLTSYPYGDTTQRHYSYNLITASNATQLAYDQSTSGPCSGDAGGPSFYGSNPEKIVGVISHGDQSCAQFGVSGRVSTVYNDFILPRLVKPPGLFSDGFELGDLSVWSGSTD